MFTQSILTMFISYCIHSNPWSHQPVFTPSCAHTNSCLYQPLLTPTCVYTNPFSHQTVFTPTCVYTNLCSYQPVFTPTSVQTNLCSHQSVFKPICVHTNLCPQSLLCCVLILLSPSISHVDVALTISLTILQSLQGPCDIQFCLHVSLLDFLEAYMAQLCLLPIALSVLITQIT